MGNKNETTEAVITKIQKVGWEEGIELEAIVENEKIILQPKE